MTRLSWCPSAARRAPTTCCRSCATSPPAATCPTAGWRRWPSTTTGSAGSARLASSVATCSLPSREDLAAAAIDLRVLGKFRNWHSQYLDRHPGAMAADGTKRGIAVLRRPRAPPTRVAGGVPRRHRPGPGPGRRGRAGSTRSAVLRPPGLRRMFRDAATRAALHSLPAGGSSRADLVFTAHSIPESMAGQRPRSPAGTGQRVPGSASAGGGARRGEQAGRWRLAYSSRSGPPSAPWLVPDGPNELAPGAAACRAPSRPARAPRGPRRVPAVAAGAGGLLRALRSGPGAPGQAGEPQALRGPGPGRPGRSGLLGGPRGTCWRPGTAG